MIRLGGYICRNTLSRKTRGIVGTASPSSFAVHAHATPPPFSLTPCHRFSTSIRSLAKNCDVAPIVVAKIVISSGIPLTTVDDVVSDEVASLVRSELGVEVDQTNDDAWLQRASKLFGVHLGRDDSDGASPASVKPRLPYVTLLGHVDHGKSTLARRLVKALVPLDGTPSSSSATNDAELDELFSEAGDITQVIRPIRAPAATLLDTPGHAAFTACRDISRHLADVNLLVLAADAQLADLPLPWLAELSDVPTVVVVTKIDQSPDARADVQRLAAQLADASLLTEPVGGDIPIVGVSATDGIGIDNLVELLQTLFEMGEYKAASAPAAVRGRVLDAWMDRFTGASAQIALTAGTLRTGATLVSLTPDGRATYARVRSVDPDPVGPGETAVVSGFVDLPTSGDRIFASKSVKVAKRAVSKWNDMEEADRARRARAPSGADVIPAMLQGQLPASEREDNVVYDSERERIEALQAKEQREAEREKRTLRLLLKVDSVNAQSAVSEMLVEIQSLVAAYNAQLRGADADTASVYFDVLSMAVGSVTTADVEAAADTNCHAIVTFGAPDQSALPTVARLADQRGVRLERCHVIYQVVSLATERLEELLPPKRTLKRVGKATVGAVFPVGKHEIAAGLAVDSGAMKHAPNMRFTVRRGDTTVGEELVSSSLRHVKAPVKEAKSGTECGLCLDNFADLQVGDVIECHEVIVEKRTLQRRR